MRSLSSSMYFGLFSIISLPVMSETISEEKNQTEEIVVTATRTGETDLQETPMAISVFSEESLNQHGIENVRDLVRLSPGLNISQNSEFAHIYIRGVGSNNSFIGSDPSSTLYVDGVYISRPLALFSDFVGTERVEVLRGPQGVLYGRNSTGGAINVISETPDDNDRLKFQAGVGSYNEQHHRIFGNLAIGEGVAANLAISRELRDGYVENDGEDDLIDKDLLAARSAIRFFSENDQVELILRGDYQRSRDTGTAYKSTFEQINHTVESETIIPGTGGAELIDDFFTVNTTSPTFYKTLQRGVSMEFNVQLSDALSLTYLPAYRSSEVSSALDSDWTEVNHKATEVEENQRQYSHELRLLYESARVSLLLGGYLFKEDVESDITVNLLDVPGYSRFDENLTTENNAIFTNASYHITDNTSISIGARSNRERKTFTGYNRVFLFGGAVDSTTPRDHKDKWNEVTPKLLLEHRLNDSIFFYGSVSEGFKSGGINFSDGTGFDPENILSYETGSKITLFDQMLTINSAVFYYKYRDLQVSSFEGSAVAPRVVILNAAKATVKGAEIEFSMVPNDYYDISGSVAFLDAKYDEFLTGRSKNGAIGAKIDAEGNDLNHSPKWTANLDLGFHHPVGAGKMNYLLSAYWQDKEYFTAFNDELTSQDAYHLIDLRVSYQTPAKTWEVAAFGRNLMNKEYSNGMQDFADTGVALNIMPPRTYGVEFTYQSL